MGIVFDMSCVVHVLSSVRAIVAQVAMPGDIPREHDGFVAVGAVAPSG